MTGTGWRRSTAARRGLVTAGTLAALTLGLVAADLGHPAPAVAPIAAGSVTHQAAAPMDRAVTPTPTPSP